MADHKLKIADKSTANSQVNPATTQLPRRSYVVAVDALLKNGKTYKRGQKVELDEQTAERAIAAGDIKPPKQETKS